MSDRATSRAQLGPSRSFRWSSIVALALLLYGLALTTACESMVNIARPAGEAAAKPLPGQPTGVFSPARGSLGQAAREYFGSRPAAVQPIPFPHVRHIEQGLTCTDYCHESVTKGPKAGLPSVNTCMICHEQIATDRPLIQQVTEYKTKGLEIPWQRVYGFTPEAHVRFNHAPHIQAKVECSTCHGAVDKMTVAERAVDHNMGFCVDCHRENKASNDCLTCHY